MAPEKTETTPDPEPTMASILARLADIAGANQVVQAEQLKQTRRRSCLVGPHISQFNLRGQKDYPMPELKCDVYAPFKNTPMLHSFDREEVELFNRLEPGEYHVTLNDGAPVTINVVAVMNSVTNRLEELALRGAKDGQGYAGLFNNENKQQFVSLRLMLREMLDYKGIEHDDILTMTKEAQLIKAGKLAVSVGE